MFLTWWTELGNIQQYAFVVAISATIIMVLFIILMLIGMDGAESFDGDIDLDMDFDMDDIDAPVDVYNSESITSVSGLKILTVRGVLAFLSIGGWTVYGIGDSLELGFTLLIGLSAGILAAYLLALAMKQAMKLEGSGNLNYQTAIGKNAVVYIRVPKETSGKGKVMLTHQGKMIEVDAITKGKEDLTSKTEVKIVELHDATTLVVEKLGGK